jgi:hypothetical protein
MRREGMLRVDVKARDGTPGKFEMRMGWIDERERA